MVDSFPAYTTYDWSINMLLCIDTFPTIDRKVRCQNCFLGLIRFVLLSGAHGRSLVGQDVDVCFSDKRLLRTIPYVASFVFGSEKWRRRNWNTIDPSRSLFVIIVGDFRI